MAFLFHRAKWSAPEEQPSEAEAPKLHEADLAAVYYGERQGGDFYDFVRVSPDRVVFGLLDVAGHVQDTRPILLAAQKTFRTLPPRLFAAEEVNEAEAMVELCLELNRTVLATEGGVRSCPAFAGCYNETLGTVCYFNAGHTAGLVRDNTGVSELRATGLPLGLFSHATCDAPMVAMQSGAALLLVSRGVLEGKCGDEEFGLARVKQNLQGFVSGTAKATCLGVLDGVRKFMCKPPTHDDVTALCLLRAASPDNGKGETKSA
jgi:serine phosphatase RsbU (regulator of sigma subunit)